MAQAIKAAQNPNLALSQLANNNPALANVIKLCQGKDPKQVFYSECGRLGVNPDDVLNQLR